MAGRSFALFVFGQFKQIVRLTAVSFCLDVLIAAVGKRLISLSYDSKNLCFFVVF